MAKSVTWDDHQLRTALQLFDPKIDRALTAVIGFHAPRAEAYAKANAPWVDRTTNARNGLFARPERLAPIYRIIVGHAVPYGIWLEVKNSGRYAIITPTIVHEGNEVMKTVAGLFAAMQRGG